MPLKRPLLAHTLALRVGFNHYSALATLWLIIIYAVLQRAGLSPDRAEGTLQA